MVAEEQEGGYFTRDPIRVVEGTHLVVSRHQ
jgi:hypothetical protein